MVKRYGIRISMHVSTRVALLFHFHISSSPPPAGSVLRAQQSRPEEGTGRLLAFAFATVLWPVLEQVSNAVRELEYHALLMDTMGLDDVRLSPSFPFIHQSLNSLLRPQ